MDVFSVKRLFLETPEIQLDPCNRFDTIQACNRQTDKGVVANTTLLWEKLNFTVGTSLWSTRRGGHIVLTSLEAPSLSPCS